MRENGALQGLIGGFATLCAVLAFITWLASRRAEANAPPLGRWHDVAGARLHYTDQGQGRTVVLIHGLGGNLRNFAPELVAHLAQGHRVIAVDRPGAGYSAITGPHPDIPQQARMIADLITALDCGPVVLAGHSLGGALSLALVQARPDLVAGLTLLAPLTQPITDVPAQFRALMIRSAGMRALFAWVFMGLGGLLAGMARQMPAFAPDPVPAHFSGQGGGALLFRPATFDAASLDAQGVPDLMPDLVAGYGAIARPVHVLFGRGDQILPPHVHADTLVTQVPGARLTMVDGGHMLPYVHADLTARWIADAVAGIAA
jgi:pimeloyl-ACP methyl ester carboxylesterase